MSQHSALSEIEKSSDRTRTGDFLRNIWSNQRYEEPITDEEIQNNFFSTYDEQNVDGNEFTNIKETEHALPKEIFSDYSAESPNKDHNLKSTEVNAVVPKSDDPNVDRYDFSEMGAGLHNSDTDVDDTSDYFDSEDEYFETYRKTFEDPKYMSSHGMVYSPYSSEGSGRYSRGIAQYYDMPVFMNSIQKYADSNGFEVHDVKADGNCLFRAIADQLSINGVFGNSPESLRKSVLRHLRLNPLQEDGSHLEAFLFGETWEQYLSRMEKTTEWCDHIILKAAVDALGMRVVIYNVYETDVRRTEVLPGGHQGRTDYLTIYLGHLGEFHYLSLRPKNWEKEWQYKALLFRHHACTKYMESVERKRFLQSNMDNMKRLNVAEKEALKNMLGLEPTDGQSQSKKCTLSRNLGYYLCQTYGLSDLEPEESKDSQQCCIGDSFHVDSRTGIPLLHLFFMFRHLIPRLMIVTDCQYRPPVTVDGIRFQYIGTLALGIDVYLRDITKWNKMQTGKMKRDATVVAHTMQGLLSKITPDTESTHPGYLRVKVLSSGTEFATKSLFRHAGQIYLKHLEVPQEMTLPQRTAQCVVGFHCEFPSTNEWRNRPRKFHWPPKDVISAVQESGCTVIPKHHPQSSHPEIEWKYDFSTSETILLKILSEARVHGLYTLKILLESCSARRLKNKHIKAVFYSSCEQIPVETWETNFGGAILYSITYLLECLKRKNLPHYFIPSRNLFDCYTEEQIDDLYFQAEAVRLFPIQSVQFLASKYGYSYGSKLEAIIFQNCRNFAENRNLVQAFKDDFLPGTIRTVKFLARRGWYDAAFFLLRDTYEIQFCSTCMAFGEEFFSLSEFLRSALVELRQKASRIILAKTVEKECGINLLNSLVKKEELFVKDVLQWEVNFKIAWLKIPAEKTKTFELLAEFFHEFSKNELKRDNTDLASLGIAEAIHCLERAIQDNNMFDVTEIEDEDLNREIQAQKSYIMKKLKEKLKDCYIHTYWISQLYRTYSPLENYMPAVEELSKEMPEMYGIVSIMFRFLRNHNKRKEYEELYDLYVGAGPKHVHHGTLKPNRS